MKKMKELISQAFKLKFYEEKSLFSWYHPITIKASRFDTEKFFQSQFSEAKVLDNTLLRHSFTPSIDFSIYLLKGLYHGSGFCCALGEHSPLLAPIPFRLVHIFGKDVDARSGARRRAR